MCNQGHRGVARVLRWVFWISQLVCTVALAQDVQSPTVPSNFSAVASSSTGVAMTWTASTDNVAVTGYQVERCQGSGCSASFTQFNISPSSGWVQTGLTAATTYGYRIRARDAVPNYSAFTSIVYVTTQAGGGDTQAPTVPANFSAVASSSTAVTMTWTASTDNIAVTGYQVERCQGAGCNASFTQINVTSVGHTDTGRAASTTYGYRLRARDAVPNYSAYTSTIYVTTPAAGGDTQAPTVPSAVTATAVSSTQVKVTWTASTDNIGVTGYAIERCAGSGCTTNFTQVGTSTTTSFISGNQSASSTYRYRLRARDVVPNWSGYSQIATATTPAAVTVTYFHNDVAGTPLVATDSSGNVAWKQNYRPYGDQLASLPSGSTNHIGFAGKQFDSATGLSYMGARYYDPSLGRFLAMDPAGFDAENLHSFNRYAYSNNNPYKFVDPDGHSPVDVAFLAYDLGKLSIALYTGVGVGPAAMDVAWSVIGVASPIPGTGQALKASRVVVNGVELARTAERTVAAAKSADKVAGTAAKTKKASTLKPGPFAKKSIPGHRGKPTRDEQKQVNEIMKEDGCHTCGTKDPGTKSGNSVVDHQPPQALDDTEEFLPHCIDCMRRQGGEVLQEILKNGGH